MSETSCACGAPDANCESERPASGCGVAGASGAVAVAKDYVTFGAALRAAVLVSLLFSGLSILVYDRVFAMKVLVFDMSGFLVRIRQDAVRGELPEAEYRKRFDQLEEALRSVPKNTVVLSSDVALGRNWKMLETGDLPIAEGNILVRKQ